MDRWVGGRRGRIDGWVAVGGGWMGGKVWWMDRCE